MRVDAEVASGAEEEGFALFPLGACVEEGLAGVVECCLRGVGFEVGQLVGQLFGLGGEGAISGSDGVVDELGRDGCSLPVGGVGGGVVLRGLGFVFAAGGEGDAQGGDGRHVQHGFEKLFHLFISF